ncbi:KH domain-containing protein [bacterium]|nr:KH domain-containing protein [bacterium]
MKQLIEYIAKSLVDNPDAVHVTEQTSGDGTVLELKVANEDLGRIIGQKGQTVKALRQLLTAAATKTKSKVSLVIQE